MDQAMAAYDGTVANYRETVLTGFQQVEDNLAALRILEKEADTQQRAVVASQKSLELSLTRYRGRDYELSGSDHGPECSPR
jgi:outer membrane protein TolC